jgi:hypothetical protein
VAVDRLRVDPAVVAYLLVVPLVAVQSAVLGDPGGRLRGALPYLAAAAAVVAARWLAPRDAAQVTAWVRVLAGAGVALAAWILGAFAVALPVGVGEPDGFYTVKALVTTPVGDHNTAAGLLLPGIAAASVASVHDRRWTAGLVVTTLGLVATLSRGAVVVLLVVAVATWPLVSERQVRTRLLSAAVTSLGLVLLAALWLGAAPSQGVPEPDGPFGASVVGRADLIVRGLEVGAANPLLGVGLGSFAAHAGGLPPPNHHAHNLVAHAFAEGGVALAVVSVAIPVVLVLRLRRVGRGELRDVLLVGGAGLVLHAQHDIMGGLVGYEVLLAVLLGLAAARRAPVRAEG